MLRKLEAFAPDFASMNTTEIVELKEDEQNRDEENNPFTEEQVLSGDVKLTELQLAEFNKNRIGWPKFEQVIEQCQTGKIEVSLTLTLLNKKKFMFQKILHLLGQKLFMDNFKGREVCRSLSRKTL